MGKHAQIERRPGLTSVEWELVGRQEGFKERKASLKLLNRRLGGKRDVVVLGDEEKDVLEGDFEKKEEGMKRVAASSRVWTSLFVDEKENQGGQREKKDVVCEGSMGLTLTRSSEIVANLSRREIQ